MNCQIQWKNLKAMTFQTLLSTIPGCIDQLGEIPRESRPWRTFLREKARPITTVLFLKPVSPGHEGQSIAFTFYWAQKADVVLVAEKSTTVPVFVRPTIFDCYYGFSLWLTWRLMALYGRQAVDATFVQNQLEGIRVKANSSNAKSRLNLHKNGRDMRTEHLDLM